MIPHWRRGGEGGVGGRTVAREAKHVGYFPNTTGEMQLHLHCRIQLVNAFAVTISKIQYLSCPPSLILVLSAPAFYCSHLGKHTAPSLVGLLCLLLRTQRG